MKTITLEEYIDFWKHKEGVSDVQVNEHARLVSDSAEREGKEVVGVTFMVGKIKYGCSFLIKELDIEALLYLVKEDALKRIDFVTGKIIPIEARE